MDPKHVAIVSFCIAGLLTAQTPAPVTPPTPANKAAEAKVYDEAANARTQIAAALAKAKRDNQRVLIQWGANWCGWCKWLAGTMQKNAKVRRELSYEYQVVHIDVGQFDKHIDVAKELGASFQAIPYLTVLGADGKAIVQQNTEPFEAKIDGKDGHDPDKLLAFLQQHRAAPLVASEVVAQAQATAKEQDKKVFLHFGAPWCGWCHKLEDWMARPEIAVVLAKEFVDCKVDEDRMTGGKELKEVQMKAAEQKGGGIPWFVFLDGEGTQLVHSTGPDGNTGFPYQPEEVAHFAKMLRKVQKHLSDAEIAFLCDSLTKNREEEEAKRKAAQEKAAQEKAAREAAGEGKGAVPGQPPVRIGGN